MLSSEIDVDSSKQNNLPQKPVALTRNDPLYVKNGQPEKQPDAEENEAPEAARSALMSLTPISTSVLGKVADIGVKNAAVTSLTDVNRFEVEMQDEAPQEFDSLDSLKQASTTLLPPFKMKEGPKEGILEALAEKNTDDPQKSSHNAEGAHQDEPAGVSTQIREILTPQRAKLEAMTPPHKFMGSLTILPFESNHTKQGQRATLDQKGLDSEVSEAAPNKFLSFEISRLEPRESSSRNRLDSNKKSEEASDASDAAVKLSYHSSDGVPISPISPDSQIDSAERAGKESSSEAKVSSSSQKAKQSATKEHRTAAQTRHSTTQKRLQREQMYSLAAQSYFGAAKSLKTLAEEDPERPSSPVNEEKKVREQNQKEELPETKQVIQLAQDIQQVKPMSSQLVSSKSSAKAAKKAESRVQANAEADSKRGGTKATGRWTREEHFRFLEALKIYGKEWKKVQQHVGTRSSTQARSHAQKFFVKLEKKHLTMEQFLETLDMSNLRNMFENDSDYGEEADMGACNDMVSQSATSMVCSQSAKSNIKSPRAKYRKPTFQVNQSRAANAGKQQPNLASSATENPAMLAIIDPSDSQQSRTLPQKELTGCYTEQVGQGQALTTDKSPAKAASDIGPLPTVGSSGNFMNHPDSMSTQATQPIVQKVTHKTPQIKPSVPGLAMPRNTIPDTYSNDDKTNEGFALPLVGKRRRGSQSGLPLMASQPQKRQHLQNSSNKKEVREVPAQFNSLEMKRVKSAYPAAENKPFSELLHERSSQQPDGCNNMLQSNFGQDNVQLMQNLQMQLNSQGQFVPSVIPQVGFQLPMGLSTAGMLVPEQINYGFNDALTGQQQTHQMRINNFAHNSVSLKNQYDLNGVSAVPMQHAQSMHLPTAVSQTPRLKANTMTSPILGAFDQVNGRRAAVSVIDQEYDLMGLSQKEVLDEESFLVEPGRQLDRLEDINHNFVKNESLKLPYEAAVDAGFTADQDPLLADNDGLFQDLHENAGFGLRNRSMTFHFDTNPLRFDLLNGLVDPKTIEEQQRPTREMNPRMSFDMNEQNNL